MTVVDLTHVMAGPFCTHVLGLLGAEVIKVERRGEGDVFRHYDRRPEFEAMAPSFQAVNTGKKSITLDLKNPEALQVVLDLVAKADILVENYRPGVLAKLGLGWEACQAVNSELIYCSISGYGQEGPLRDNPAYDHIVQAVCGVMSLTGDPAGDPAKVGFPMVDTFTGYAAALACVSAVLQKLRFGGGGRHLDVAMLDSSLLLLISMVGPFLIAGDVPKRVGNRGFNPSPTAATFVASDGPLLLGANTQKQFEKMCGVLGCPDLAADPRFSDPHRRIDNEAALLAILRPLFASRTAEAWEGLFNAADVPAGAVRTIDQVTLHPHVVQRHLTAEFPLPGTDRTASTLHLGFDLGRPDDNAVAPPPRLGEHTRSVLEGLGYDAAKIAGLEAAGAI
jgi:crotonobetainyl-CoA:carnitine CoA-transferase CaiB-like acyl-CoA transferase